MAGGKGRLLALDLGTKRIGVAVSDDMQTVATPYQTIKRIGNMPVEHATIKDLAEEISAISLVVGIPLSLAGKEEIAAKKIQSEIKSLRRNVGLPVEVIDERLSTVVANQSLQFQSIKGKDRKDMVDQIAAAVILQSWLDKVC